MSAVEAARTFLRKMEPDKNMTVEDFARSMFMWQMEIYGSYAGRDLDPGFDNIDEKDKEGWYEAARKHKNALPKWNKS